MNFDLIRWCFGNFSLVFYTWLYMKLSTSCLVYYCFHFWSNNRMYYLAKEQLKFNLQQQLLKQDEDLKVDGEHKELKRPMNNFVMYDFIWLIVYICYLVGFIIIPAFITMSNQLPPASAMTVIMEQVMSF